MEFIKRERPPFANVLIYGPPKSGKTTAAASAPGTVLFINADLPNATLFARTQDYEGRIMEPRWGGFAMLSEIMHAAYQEPTWDSVVLDTYGEAYRRLLDETSHNAVRPSLNQRGDVVVHLERFARFMCEAPVNFVIVCHELIVRDEDAGTVERIAFTGSKSGSESQSPKLMGMTDIIAYTGVVDVEGEGRKYMAQLVSGKGRQGGDRFDALGDSRELDLTEWFMTAGVYVGDEKQTTDQETRIAA